MILRLLLWGLLPLLVVGQAYLMDGASSRRSVMLALGENLYTLPSPILKATALEYEGVVSDVIFLRTLVFFGKTFERTELPRVREWEWDWIRDNLVAVTDVDPWFSDPYFMANSLLVWEAGRILDGNLLLEKGTKYRDWDWMPPFMAGFNYHYYLGADERASEFLMESAQRPGASPLIATLAARLARSTDQTENAIAFLEEMYRQSPDGLSRKMIKARLTALLDIQALGRAVAIYRQRFGLFPVDLQQLVERGILVRIPAEPYGGEYRLTVDNQVESSTDFGKFVE